MTILFILKFAIELHFFILFLLIVFLRKVNKKRYYFVFSIASLPDLSMHTIFCNFWGNIGKKDDLYFQNNLDNIFTSLLSKSSPAACKRREYHAIVTKCWKEEKTSYI